MSCIGHFLNELREATADLVLPAEASMPASFSIVLTHPPIIVLEAGLAGPNVDTNKCWVLLASRLLPSDRMRSFLSQNTGSMA